MEGIADLLEQAHAALRQRLTGAPEPGLLRGPRAGASGELSGGGLADAAAEGPKRD
jgi:hypothetical protein